MKKYLTVTIILLFIGLAVAPSINANVIKENLVEFTTEICGLDNNKFLIFGTGDISWLHIENLSWHIGGKYRKLYRINLIVGNGPGGLPLDYRFFIKNLKTGEIFNKDTLPRHVYLNNIIGYLRANYYSYGSHGPTGFFFTIFGIADDYYSWEY